MKGTVISMPDRKGFCFIKGTNGAEYFLHKQDFNGFWKDLEKDFIESTNDIVITFDAVSAEKGPRATNARRMDYPNQAV